MKYSKLSHVSESYLQIRFYLLQSFNEMVKDGLSFFNISTKPGYRLCSVNKWIVSPGWRTTCERFVDYCSDPSNLIGSIRYVFLWRSLGSRLWKRVFVMIVLQFIWIVQRPTWSKVFLPRMSNHNLEQHKIDTNCKYTTSGQLYQVLDKVPPEKLHHPSLPLLVVFKGEQGDDSGGLCRETMTSIASELEAGSIPLFIPSPNGRNNLGYNKDVYLPDPNATSQKSIALYEFLGKLFGMAIRTQSFISLNMAPCIWKLLTGIPVDMDDIISLDDLLRDVCYCTCVEISVEN